MLKFLFKKESQLESLIYDYLDALKSSQDNFSKALNTCLYNPNCENSDFHIQQTHKYESRADDIREEIKSMMYGKALIPESRGDIMGMLDRIDMIPHLFERVLYTVQTQRLIIPDFIVSDIKDLVQVSLECCQLLYKQVEILFKKTEGIRAMVTTIDANESHCDHMQRRIVIKIFDSDIGPFLKIQLKDLVEKIGQISDQADSVSKRINIINIKRRV